MSGRAASVRRLWGGLPPDMPPLKAVLERHSDHAIIFISGTFLWNCIHTHTHTSFFSVTSPVNDFDIYLLLFSCDDQLALSIGGLAGGWNYCKLMFVFLIFQAPNSGCSGTYYSRRATHNHCLSSGRCQKLEPGLSQGLGVCLVLELVLGQKRMEAGSKVLSGTQWRDQCGRSPGRQGQEVRKRIVKPGQNSLETE